MPASAQQIKNMPPMPTSPLVSDYGRVEAAIAYLQQNFRAQPDLREIAAHVGLSEYHFQRLFSRWAGISPKKFLQFLTIGYAKRLLAESQSLLDTTYAAGLSSPGRLHDLFVTHEAMTPGQFKRRGAGLQIAYGFHPTRFGHCLLALTARGICGLSFVDGDDREGALQALADGWPQADLVEDDRATRSLVRQIFEPVETGEPLHLLLKGTNFQIKVWTALLQLSPGTAVSYGTLAAMAGEPGAARALGSAVSHNPIAYLIPCHRVIRKMGDFGQYRWGGARKRAILGWEATQRYLHA